LPKVRKRMVITVDLDENDQPVSLWFEFLDPTWEGWNRISLYGPVWADELSGDTDLHLEALLEEYGPLQLPF
jgi:hypothetical protein